MTYFEIMRNAIASGEKSPEQAVRWLCYHGVYDYVAYAEMYHDK